MKKFDRAILIFIALGIWALPVSQIFWPSVARSGQTHTSADIVDLEEFVFNIVSPVQKELEDLRNDVSALNEKVEILQWHDHGG